MKQVSMKILLAMLALSAAQVQAVRYTNKTQVAFKPQGVNLPMADSLYHRLHKAHDAKRWNGKIQASPFFQRSENQRDLGRLLLFNKKDAVSLKRLTLTAPAPLVPAGEVDFGYVIHSNNPAAAGGDIMRGVDTTFNLKLAPERTSYGLSLGYEHDLGHFVKGLHFQVSAPVVHIQHHLNKIVTSSDAETQKNVDKYFSGKFQEAAGANAQDFLKKAILVDQRAVGVADVELELNYDAVHRPWGCWHLGVGLTLPTGNTPDGTYAFQPVVGNNNHLGIGAQSKMVVDLLSHNEHHASLHTSARYRYLLESDEVRTLGIKDRNFGQYHLLAKTGSPEGSMLQPAANILTMAVDVTPGHQFDGSASLAYSWRKLSVDLGYNLFFRNKESLRLRNAFADNTYAIVNRNYNASRPVDIAFLRAIPGFPDIGAIGDANLAPVIAATTLPTASKGSVVTAMAAVAPGGGGGGAPTAANITTAATAIATRVGEVRQVNFLFGVPLSASHDNLIDGGAANGVVNADKLDLRAATDERQMSHAIFASVGLAMNGEETPVIAGIGGSYEFAGANNGLEQWTVWAKAGISF